MHRRIGDEQPGIWAVAFAVIGATVAKVRDRYNYDGQITGAPAAPAGMTADVA
jgi:hypothetical protein